jgi:two-component system NtrC family sensor kinase
MTAARNLAALQKVISNLNLEAGPPGARLPVIPEICRLFDGEAAMVVLQDDTPKSQVVRSVWSEQEGWFPTTQLDLKGALKARLQNELAGKASAGMSQANLDAVVKDLNGLVVRSMLSAPLEVHGYDLGWIAVLNKHSGAFSNGDQELLSTISVLVANTLVGARLIQQLKVVNASLEVSHRELLHSRNTLRALFDSLPDAFYIVDQNYQVKAINMSCANRAGKSPRELVGRTCYRVLYGKQSPCAGCRVVETLQNGRSTSRAKHGISDGGEPTEWEVSTYPIYNQSDQVIQAILLEQDVTEKRRLESMVTQNEKLAAVGQLAAGVAHEINNPLTAIIANSQLLQRALPPDDDLQESVELIARAGARAAQVVRNLLDFARKEQVHLDPIDVNESLQRALELVQHELVNHSIQLVFQPEENLPLILASQDRLLGVWLNLLLNAIDAIEHEHGKLQISTFQKGDEIHVVLTDNGKGIPPERIERIFEPFYTTKAPGRGTGLGLSVCHQVIKQHDGHILVDSQVGEGTRFTVILPVHRP